MRIITILFLLIQINVVAQNKEIASKFQKESLPYCISYDESNPDSLNQIKTYSKSVTFPISVSLANILTNPTRNKLLNQEENQTFKPKYFADKLIAKKTTFTALTYSRITGDEIENIETYLCTIDSKGNCISMILIAASIYGGTGIDTEGGRIPYYDQTECCIKKELSIIVTPKNGEKKKYQIKNDGEIVEVK